MKQARTLCPVHTALGTIGGKWKLEILWNLCQKPLHFNELKRTIGNVSTKVLSDQLKSMEADGLVIRRTLNTRPPQVEYSLTPIAHELQPALQQLHDWSVRSLYQV